MTFQTPCRCIVSESVSSLSLSQWVISLSGQVWNWANKRINYLSRYAFELDISVLWMQDISRNHNHYYSYPELPLCHIRHDVLCIIMLSFIEMQHWRYIQQKKQKYSFIVNCRMEDVFQTVVKTIGKAIGAWCKRVAVCVHMLSPYLWRGDKKMTEARGPSQHRPSTLALTAPRYPCYPQYIIHTILNILSILHLIHNILNISSILSTKKLPQSWP